MKNFLTSIPNLLLTFTLCFILSSCSSTGVKMSEISPWETIQFEDQSNALDIDFIDDNHGFYKALQGKNKVLPIFIFDSNILEKLPKKDARIEFILSALGAIDVAMKGNRSNVGIYHGTPEAIFKEIIQTWSIEKVICNEDYEPYSVNRDQSVRLLLEKSGIVFEQYKDQVIFEKKEILYIKFSL